MGLPRGVSGTSPCSFCVKVVTRGCSPGWLAGWLAGLLAGWLAGWLGGRLAGRLAGQLASWRCRWQSHWRAGRCLLASSLACFLACLRPAKQLVRCRWHRRGADGKATGAQAPACLLLFSYRQRRVTFSRKRLGLRATAGRRPSAPWGNFIALRARLSEEGTFRVRNRCYKR